MAEGKKLKKHSKHLEDPANNRAADLSAVDEQLQREIAERERVEQRHRSPPRA